MTEDELPPGLWSKLSSLDTDTDGDDALSLDEVDTLIASVMKSNFEKKDINSDGQLTADEVGDRLWASLGTADTDSSESVSFDEFKTWLQDKQDDDASSDDDDTDNDSDDYEFGHSHHGHVLGLAPVPGNISGVFSTTVTQIASQMARS